MQRFGHPFSLLMIDIDILRVSTIASADAGDEAIRRISKVLREKAPEASISRPESAAKNLPCCSLKPIRKGGWKSPKDCETLSNA